MAEPPRSQKTPPPRRALPEQLAGFEEGIHLGNVPDACPYLPDRVATFRIANGFLGAMLYEQLLEIGYRRNGDYMYRPACRTCHECRPLRVLVQEFERSKSQRRVWNRCAPVFRATFGPAECDDERIDLYRRYLQFQHDDEGEEVDEERYARFLTDSCLGGRTFELRLWAGNRLAAVGILDRLQDALSSVYFYFDPVYAPLSPGTFSALYEIEMARRWGMRYYYLGYYIADCASMNYKRQFRPCEIRLHDASGWERIGY
jgi:arginine-tRNA-protein transferase